MSDENINNNEDINIEENIVDPWFDLRIQNLCNDKEFTSKIQVELDRKREDMFIGC